MSVLAIFSIWDNLSQYQHQEQGNSRGRDTVECGWFNGDSQHEYYVIEACN